MDLGLHLKDNIIYFASVDLGTIQDDIVCTNFIHNNENCTSVYLSTFIKHPATDRSANVQTVFPSTLATLFPTRQTLVFCDGEYARIQTSWLINSNIYQNISDALVTLNLGSPLPILPQVQQGYLVALLKLHRKGSFVVPLYDLDEAWVSLLNSEVILTGAPVDIQVTLVNMGFRSYFDVNKFILISLENHTWDTLWNIITYYKKHFNFKPYKALVIKASTETEVPPDILKFFLI